MVGMGAIPIEQARKVGKRGDILVTQRHKGLSLAKREIGEEGYSIHFANGFAQTKHLIFCCMLQGLFEGSHRRLSKVQSSLNAPTEHAPRQF